MPSRPPGQLIVLPAAVTRWHAVRLRRRKMKIAVASVGLAVLLVALLDVIFEGSETGPGEGESFLDDSPFRPSSSGEPRDMDGPAWFTTSGSGR
ncbi:hypothetical protein [Melittangium boletus]|uniref:hypothetical protein n=1 Tax=Melittangium boletus TaxID=83453 RepID=UPI003DA47910